MLGRIGWVSRITKKGSEVTAIRVCALIEVDSLIRADDSVRVEETAKVFVQPRFGSTTWVTQVILGQVSQVKQEKRPPLVMLWTKAKRSANFLRKKRRVDTTITYQYLARIIKMKSASRSN